MKFLFLCEIPKCFIFGVQKDVALLLQLVSEVLSLRDHRYGSSDEQETVVKVAAIVVVFKVA